MTLRTIARAAALRAARALVLPELRQALDAREARTWDDLIDVCLLLREVDRRMVDLGAGRDQLLHERDALQEELAEHLDALEEVRARLAAEQRGAALLLAQREAQAAIAESQSKLAHGLEARLREERSQAVQVGAQVVKAEARAAAAERRAREAEERLRAAQLAAEGGA